MKERLVDPFALVTYLLSEHDGSQRMAVAIRRAMQRALPKEHPIIDVITAALHADASADLDSLRRDLVVQWKSILH